ncbi:MAG: hypothetical protein EB027_07845 [Actinobacteria bacterium]|nr:hypothetical protein [Actinomycetota bacterium]
MATTFTVTETAPGDVLYTFAALTRNDVSAAIDVSRSERIVAQVCDSAQANIGTDSVLIEGSLDGSNWGLTYAPDAVSLSVGAAVSTGWTSGSWNATTQSYPVLPVQPMRYIRVSVRAGAGASSTTVKVCVLVRTR